MKQDTIYFSDFYGNMRDEQRVKLAEWFGDNKREFKTKTYEIIATTAHFLAIEMDEEENIEKIRKTFYDAYKRLTECRCCGKFLRSEETKVNFSYSMTVCKECDEEIMRQARIKKAKAIVEAKR